MLVTNIHGMGARADRTRERLLTAALELFAERGYDATTAGEIAARAGVTEMTFFRHFPSKASLLVDDPYDPLIGAAIHRQPSNSTRSAGRPGASVRHGGNFPLPRSRRSGSGFESWLKHQRCARAWSAAQPRPRR